MKNEKENKTLTDLARNCSHFDHGKCLGNAFKYDCDMSCDFGDCIKEILEKYAIIPKDEYAEFLERRTAKDELTLLLNFIRTETFHKGFELKKVERKILDLLEGKDPSSVEECKYYRKVDYGYRESFQCYAQKCAPEVECCGNPMKCSKYPKVYEEG